MIVVFGSVNIDLVARVPRLPAAGETVLGPGYALVPGGKGANQALAARRAGAEVVLAGAVGRDTFAGLALATLAAEGVDLARIARVEAPTGAAFIAVDAAGRNQIVVAAGANLLASAASLDGLAAGPGDLLMLQGEVPEAEIETAARWARARGLMVVLNRAPAGPVPPDLMALLDVLVMNEHEAAEVGRDLGLAEADPDGIAMRIDKDFGVAAVITLGGDGALAWSRGIRHRSPALPVEVVDTTAAGDAFSGALAAHLARGRGWEAALDFAAAAGSLACTKAGAQPSLGHRAEIEPRAAGLAELRNPEPYRRLARSPS